MQLAVASSSLMPRRLPKKVITFGTCIALALRDRLLEVLDDPVVVGLDVEAVADRCRRRRSPSSRSGHSRGRPPSPVHRAGRSPSAPWPPPPCRTPASGSCRSTSATPTASAGPSSRRAPPATMPRAVNEPGSAPPAVPAASASRLVRESMPPPPVCLGPPAPRRRPKGAAGGPSAAPAPAPRRSIVVRQERYLTRMTSLPRWL